MYFYAAVRYKSSPFIPPVVKMMLIYCASLSKKYTHIYILYMKMINKKIINLFIRSILLIFTSQ